jgi:uncharacterized protein YjiS (DUF1127 family)
MRHGQIHAQKQRLKCKAFDIFRPGQARLPLSTPTRSVPFRKYWRAFQQWRQRNRLLDQLHQLDHRELNDLGISRGEIGYVASNPSIEPRGVLSGRS